jgi:hypothetical protein
MPTPNELVAHLRIDLDVTVNDLSSLTAAAIAAVRAAGQPANTDQDDLLETISNEPAQAIINAMADPCDLLNGVPGIEYARSVISPAVPEEVRPQVEQHHLEESRLPADKIAPKLRNIAAAAQYLQDGQRVRGIDFAFQYDSDDDPAIEPTIITEEYAPLIKGMLWAASTIVIDELFADAATLRAAEKIDEETINSTMIISNLPQIYRSAYTALFAQQLLVATVDVSRKLIEWEPLASEAEELALYCIIEQVGILIEDLEFGEGSGRGSIADPSWHDTLTDTLFEDSDMLMLWTSSDSEAGWKRKRPSAAEATTAVRGWFEPFREEFLPSPYACNQPD